MILDQQQIKIMAKDKLSSRLIKYLIINEGQQIKYDTHSLIRNLLWHPFLAHKSSESAKQILSI